MAIVEQFEEACKKYHEKAESMKLLVMGAGLAPISVITTAIEEHVPKRPKEKEVADKPPQGATVKDSKLPSDAGRKVSRGMKLKASPAKPKRTSASKRSRTTKVKIHEVDWSSEDDDDDDDDDDNGDEEADDDEEIDDDDDDDDDDEAYEDEEDKRPRLRPRAAAKAPPSRGAKGGAKGGAKERFKQMSAAMAVKAPAPAAAKPKPQPKAAAPTAAAPKPAAPSPKAAAPTAAAPTAAPTPSTPTPFLAAANHSKDLQEALTNALRGLASKGISPGSSASSTLTSLPETSVSVGLVELNSMFDRESARTKSACLSEASTYLKDEIVKVKDSEITRLEKQVAELQIKYDEVTARLIKASSEAMAFKAMAEASQAAVIEAKAHTATWHELADTLRKDQKEMLGWKLKL